MSQELDCLEALIDRLCGRCMDATMALKGLIDAATAYCLVTKLERAESPAAHALLDALDAERVKAQTVYDALRGGAGLMEERER